MASETIDCKCTIRSISSISRLHVHTYDPCVLLHLACTSHLPGGFAFINICRKINKKTEEKGKHAISPDDRHFGFYQGAKYDSQLAKPLIHLQLFCSRCSPVGPFNQTIFYKCFSGGTFQLRYYFWTLLEATLLSIQHTYELLLYVSNSPVQFCPSPVYPAWQSHTCDPKVFLQFAFSWQEWFPLHSSTSMNQQMERRVSKVCKNCRASTML